jgi:hypothetical protein
MKTIICFFLFLLVNTSINLNAQNAATPNIYMRLNTNYTKPNAVDIHLVNLMNLKTTLELIDNNGKTVFFEEIDDEQSWAKRFKFDDLKSGNYSFKIEQSGIKLIHEVLTTKNGLETIAVKKILTSPGVSDAMITSVN